MLPLPWSVILHSPRDLDELWQKIESPDLLVIKPEQADAQGNRNARSGAGANPAPLRWAVQSIEVEGGVAALYAELTASMTIVLKGSEPEWVPIRLDGQRVKSAREGSRELLLHTVERGGWQVQLAGRGEHRVQVYFRSAVRSDPARKWLSVPIPESASTRLRLDFLAHESDIVVGSNEDFGVSDPGAGKPSRLIAHLSPRSRLEVSWTRGEGSGGSTSPLLSAQGEIAIDIDADQMRTRSSWMIRCVGGMTRALEMAIDGEDEPTELLVDDQMTEGTIERKAGKLTIPLAEALRPGRVKRVVMKTRRSFKKPGVQRVSFSGFPVAGAREQTGFIGVIQSPNLWVSPVPAQGARQIDPRELPTDLRARPSTNLAFEFREQPFQLDLSIEPLPPLVKADAKTSFWIESEVARSETTIDVFWVRGRLFDLELAVPAGLENVSIDSPATVERSSLTSENGSAGAGQLARVMRIRLTSSARDQNKVTLKVNAQQAIPPEGNVKLGLVTPLHATSIAATYEIAAESDLVLELADLTGRIRRSGETAAQTTGPVARSGPSRALWGNGNSGPLLLASDGATKELAVKIKRQKRALTHDTEISAQVSRRSIDVIQQTSFVVRFGVLGSLEIRVPGAIADRWELIDKELAERRELRTEPDGTRQYRLNLERPALEKLTLRFRYRLSVVPPLDSKGRREIVMPAITFPEGSAGPTKVGLSLASEIALLANDPSWVRISQDASAPASDTGSVVTFVQEAPERPTSAFSFAVLAHETVPMPPALVTRLLIRTVLAEDGSRDRVWCWVESHGADLAFSIPHAARWLGARVDGRIIEQVEYDPASLRYRLRFPGDVGSRPALVELEYQCSGQGSDRRLEAPRFLDGEVVLQSVWEVRLPGNDAVLGVPQGWFHENQRYWDGNVATQGPAQSASSVRAWLLGGATPASMSGIDDFDEARFDPSNRSVFVFSRSGEPVALAISVVPRSWLIAVCSGCTLFLGFLAIFSRVQFRTIWLVLAMLGLLAAMFVQTSVFLLVVQSAVIGLALTVLGLVIRRLIERSRGTRFPSRDSSVLPVRPAGESSLNRSAEVGSDDSTAIRVRVPSTFDYVPAPAVERDESD